MPRHRIHPRTPLTPAAVLPDRTETGGLINICNYHHGQHHDTLLDITGNAETTITFTWTDGRTARSTAPKNEHRLETRADR